MKRKGHVIGVVSGKGGVGKTTSVANIGASLAKYHGKRVLIIDGNITTPSLGIHMDTELDGLTVQDILKKRKPKRDIKEHESGVHIIPSEFTTKKKFSKKRLKKALSRLAKEYDLILIDGAGGVVEEVIATIGSSDEVVVVTNPELTAAVAALKVIEQADKMKKPVRAIILNKVKNESYEITARELSDNSGVETVLEIPHDRRVEESIAKRVPVAIHRPHSRGGRHFRAAAASLVGEKHKKSNLIQKLMDKFF